MICEYKSVETSPRRGEPPCGGLWFRNRIYSVQTTLLDARTGVKKVRRIGLEPKTLPDARNEMAALLQTIAEKGATRQQGRTFKDHREHYIKRVASQRSRLLS